MVAAPTIAALRRVVVRRRIGGGRGSLFFFPLEMNSGIGKARGEGRGESNDSYVEKVNVENEGDNLSPYS